MAILRPGLSGRTIKVKNLKITIGILLLICIAVFAYTFVNFINVNPFDNLSAVNAGGGVPTPIFGIYGSGAVGPLKRPMGVTVYNHNVFVTDVSAHRVAVFDYNGKPLYSFGKQGSDKGQFQFPYGITVDNSGQVYVADPDNGKISVLSQTGTFIKYFADQKDQVQKPAGVCYYDNNIFVTDIALNKVFVFDTNGKKLLEFGEKGHGAGQFNSPNDITVTQDAIYVSDSGNDRVEKFDRQGKFLALTYGKISPDQSSAFVNTRGVGVDKNGTIFVVSNLTSNLYSFTKDGKMAFQPIGKMGSSDNQFKTPNGLYIDSQNRIYIVDTLNQRVMVYHD